MARRVRFVIPALLCSALVAACSSTTSGTGSAAPPSRSNVAPDAARLVGALLTPADLPSDWTPSASANSIDDGADPNQTKIAQCLGIPDSQSERVAIAANDYKQDLLHISSNASSFRSANTVHTDLRGLLSSKAPSCLEQQLRANISAGLPNGETVGRVNVRFVPGSNGGPSDVVMTFKADVPLHASGQTILIYASLAYIAHNLVEGEVDFFGVGAPIPDSVQRTAIDAVAHRIAAL